MTTKVQQNQIYYQQLARAKREKRPAPPKPAGLAPAIGAKKPAKLAPGTAMISAASAVPQADGSYIQTTGPVMTKALPQPGTPAAVIPPSAPGAAPYTPVTTTAQQAEAMVNQQRADKRAMEKKLFGESYTAETQEDEVQLFLDEQKTQKTQLELQIERMNKVDRSEFDMSKRDANAAVDATTARFAQSREGVASSGNAMIASQFASKTQTKIGNARTQLQMRFDQRAQLLTELEKAQKQKNIDYAEQVTAQLASAENQIRQEQLRMQELASAARTEAFDFLEKAPAGSLAGFDVPSLMESFGVDQMTATVMMTVDGQKAALSQREAEMGELDFAIKMADLDSKLENAKYAGMTDDMKNFTHYKTMQLTDPQGAEEFARAVGISEKSFFSDYQSEWSEKQAYAERTFEKTSVKVPLRSKYAFDISGNGISFEKSAPNGKVLGRGQCGMFVNDILNGGSGLMGDSAESKRALINSSKPVAGAAFVEDTKDWTDHTGMVEKVYPDGSFDIREANYIRANTVSTAHIAKGSARWKTIVEGGGFFVPGGDRASDQAATASSGMGPSSDFMMYAQSLASGDLGLKDLKDLGMGKSDIAMLQTAALRIGGGSSSVSQQQISTYGQALADGKITIPNLEAMGFKPDEIRQFQEDSFNKSPSSKSSSSASSDSEFGRLLSQAEGMGLTGEAAQKFAMERLNDAYKPLTEAQGKAFKAYVTAQAENDSYNKIFRNVNQEEFSDAMNWLNSKIKDPNSPLTAETINQAIDDPSVRRAINIEMRWVAAVLREESGAAISVQEYLTKGSQFFPRKGDDPQTIKDKERARKLEESGLKAKLGNSGQRQIDELMKSLPASDTGSRSKRKGSFSGWGIPEDEIVSPELLEVESNI